MKIARLEVESFRGAPDGAYDFTRDGRAQQVVALTGAPRGGRSSVLGAVVAAREAVAPTRGLPPVASLLRRGARGGRIEVTWELEPSEAEVARTSDTLAATRVLLSGDRATVDAPAGLRRLFGRFDLGDDVAKVELIPEDLSTEAARTLPGEAALRAQRTSARPDKYAWAPAALARTMLAEAVAVRERLREEGVVVEGAGTGALERYRTALLGVVPTLRLGSLCDTGDGPEPTFASAAWAEGRTWDALSGSERRAAALAVAAVHLGLSRSLLLWDSPDRAFGPRTYAEVVEGLRSVLVDAQLVIAVDAESPIPAGALALPLGSCRAAS